MAELLSRRNERGELLHYPCEEVQTLFDQLDWRYQIRVHEVFCGAYKRRPRRARLRMLGRFLRDVRTCAPHVMRYAERLLYERHAAELVHEPPAEHASGPVAGVVVMSPLRAKRARA